VENCGGGTGGEGNEKAILCGLGMLDMQLTVCIDKMTVPGVDLSSITPIIGARFTYHHNKLFKQAK
jgi:hypothetical protein